MDLQDLKKKFLKVNWRRGLFRVWLFGFAILFLGQLFSAGRSLLSAIRENSDGHVLVEECLNESAKQKLKALTFYSWESSESCFTQCKARFKKDLFSSNENNCKSDCYKARNKEILAELNKSNFLGKYQVCSTCYLTIQNLNDGLQWIPLMIIWGFCLLIVSTFKWYKVLFHPFCAAILWIIRGFARGESVESSDATSILNPSSDTQNKDVLRYAGWWRRFAANLIDSFILVIPEYLVARILIMGFTARIDDEVSGIVGAYIISLVVGVTSNWLYSSLMESSSHQATWGKRALGIMVVDLQGERLSWARATGRYFSKFLSAIPFGLGYLFPLFTKRKQALHDLIARTLVIIK